MIYIYNVLAMLEKENTNDTEVEIETDTHEEIELEDIEEKSSDKIKKLRNELQECEKEKLTHLENLQRAKADFLNARKRLEEERRTDKLRTSKSFVEELLPLCDSFHMAMGNTESWSAVEAVWRTGVESIFAQLTSVLEAHNVKVIQPVGEPFNPELHDAVSTVPVTDKAQNYVIVQVIQPGYTIEASGKTDVLRPARVTVGEFTD